MSNDPDALDFQFPDPIKALAYSTPTPEALGTDCVYVMDASVLIAPFEDGVSNATNHQIAWALKTLHDAGRLYTAKRALQEFLRRRHEKLAEVIRALEDTRTQYRFPTIPRFPFLSDRFDYRDIETTRKSFDEAKDHLTGQVRSLISTLASWDWEDEISQTYRNVFTLETVVGPAITADELATDHKYRMKHSIPPGYRDAKKTDGGVGDVAIWHSMIHISCKTGKSVVFVSGDEKEDWVVKAGDSASVVRPELSFEFFSKTGHHFNRVSLSEFLRIAGAKAESVDAVQRFEETRRSLAREVARLKHKVFEAKVRCDQSMDRAKEASVWESAALEALRAAIRTNHPDLTDDEIEDLISKTTAPKVKEILSDAFGVDSVESLLALFERPSVNLDDRNSGPSESRSN